MRKLHETYKERIIMYVTVFMNAAGVRADRDKTIEVWLNAFSYMQITKQYLDFEKACDQFINNNENLDKMPFPGKIKQLITYNNAQDEGLGERPKVKSKIMDLYNKGVKLIEKIKTCLDYEQRKLYKREYYNLCQDMCDITEDILPDHFVSVMLEDSYIDLRLKEKENAEKILE